MRLSSFSCLYVGLGRSWPLSGRNEASGLRADETEPEVERDADEFEAFGGLAEGA